MSPRKRKAGAALESINSGMHDTIAQPVTCTSDATLQEVSSLYCQTQILFVTSLWVQIIYGQLTFYSVEI